MTFLTKTLMTALKDAPIIIPIAISIILPLTAKSLNSLNSFMCLYLLFFIGHMVHPYNLFLDYQILVMDVSCMFFSVNYSFFSL